MPEERIHRAQHKSIRDQAKLLMDGFGLTLIPICSHDHEGMSENHLTKCNTPGKMPYAVGWSKTVLSERTFLSVDEMQLVFRKNKALNLGLVLGQTPNYNIVGVDVDGEIGLEKWDELCAEHGGIPETWEFYTGGGGYRLLYALPPEMPTKKKKITFDGDHQEIAFICQGQQTILPPSIHTSGELYEWVEGRSPMDRGLVMAPDWIVEKVKEVNATEKPKMSPKAVVSATAVTTGNRNDTMTKQVFSICKSNYALGKPAALAACIAFGTNPEKFNPPLEESEIIRSFEGAWERTEKQKQKQFENAQDKDKFAEGTLAKEFALSQKEEGVHYRYRNDRNQFVMSLDTMGPWSYVSEKNLVDTIRQYLITTYSMAVGNVTRSKKIVDELKSALITDSEIGDVSFKSTFGDDTNPLEKQYYNSETVAVRNGILNIATGELSSWNPEMHYHTIGLDVKYVDKDYSVELAEWEEQVKSWLPEEESRLFMQEFIGYTLTPDCSLSTFLFICGKGRNGKSIFMDLITKMYGKYSNPFTIDSLKDKFFGTLVLDSYLLFGTDMGDNYVSDTGPLKSLVSGEPLLVNEKFEKAFPYKPIAKIMLNVNKLPQMKDTSEGLMRRARFITFPNQFEVNPDFERSLRAKYESLNGRSILFQWALEGLRRLRTNGKFTESASMSQNKEAYQMGNDHILSFLQECTYNIPEWATDESIVQRDASTPFDSLYEVYKEWCNSTGEKCRIKRTFKKDLAERDFIIKGVYSPQTGKRMIQSVMGIRISEDGQVYNFGNAIQKSM